MFSLHWLILITQNYRDLKYRSVKTSNKYFQDNIMACVGGLELFCFGPMGFKIQREEENEEEKEKKDEGVLKSCVKLISEGEEVKVNFNIYSSHFILVIGAHDQLSSHSFDSKGIMSCYVTLHYTTHNNLPLCGNANVMWWCAYICRRKHRTHTVGCCSDYL